MGVSNGEYANENTFNSSFMDREGDTDTSGRVDLINALAESGGDIINVQKNINALASALGIPTNQVFDYLITWASTVVGASSSSSVAKIEALVLKFRDTFANGGHKHNGTDGEGAKVSSQDLADFNDFWTIRGNLDVLGASGSSVDVTTEFTGKTPGGTSTSEGVLTDPSNNKITIVDALTLTNLEDGGGQKVYGRLTYAAAVWTLSFYTNEAGVETSYSIPSPTDITIFYREVYRSANRPTIGADISDMASYDFTADVVDATSTQRGLVSTSSQTFAGAKTFNGKIFGAGGLNLGAETINRFPYIDSANDVKSSGVIYDDVNLRIGFGATPQSKLHLDGGTATNVFLQFTVGATTGQTSNDGFVIGCSSTGAAQIRQRENSTLGLYTNNLQAFVITGAGSVAIQNNTGTQLATTATTGFLFISSSAGAPTGVPVAVNGTAPIHIDTTNSKLYFYVGGWIAPASAVGTVGAGNANAADITAGVLTIHAATATQPGVVSIGTQTFAGNKTFTGTITASNLTGTNTGDVTIAAFGSTPNANGLTITGQALNLQPADATNPGALSIAAQELAGDKRIMDRLGLRQTVDSTTTGTGAAPALVRSAHVFTNASLSSIERFSSPYNNHFGLITNNTGTTVIIKNLTGSPSSEQIQTPTNADYNWADKASLIVYYDTNSSKWRLIGIDFSAAVTSSNVGVFTFNINDNPFETQTSFDGFRRFPFAANITNIVAFQEIQGSSGSNTFDIQVKVGAGAWTSIVSTKPSIATTAGADVDVGIGETGTGLTAAIMTSTPYAVAAGDKIRCNLDAVQAGDANTMGILIFYEPQ